MKLIQLGDDQPIDRLAFTDVAATEWQTAKDAYLDAHHRMHSLMTLLHKTRHVSVSGQVTAAAYEAKRLREDVDRLIVALDEIVSAARRLGKP